MFGQALKHLSRAASAKFCANFLAILLILVGLAGGVARAQLSGKGEIKGVVKDPSGAVVTNATVTATEVSTGVSTVRTTNSSGIYDISPLDAGVYLVTVTASGFEKQTQTDVHVNALEIQNYNPVLTVGSSAETVTVTTLPPQLETSNAVLGATMEQDMYSALPIEMGAYGSPDQRRATDFAFLMPGVQGNNTTGNPTTNTGVVNGSGSRGAVSVVYVDGIPFVRAGGNGDPRYVWTAISVDAIDQFQVQTSGYSAIYEGQGIQNYTIKQGGKDFHGSVYEFFRNTSLDTWGFFGPVPNPATGLPVKPIEHSNEYGINLSGPLVPLSGWKDKLFLFVNYSGFRYAAGNPTLISFPTLAQQQGNFVGILYPTNPAAGQPTWLANQSSATGIGIYDPTTQTQCTANNTGAKPCRYRYGYIYGGTPGANGGAILNPGTGVNGVDVIPSSEFSAVALAMQSFLPTTGIGTGLGNNYTSPNKTGLSNWTTTERMDYVIGAKDTLTLVAAFGRQASSVPVGQTTAGRNVGPIPFNYGQVYAPKTAVGVIEETHVFTSNLVNQLKYGYARYNGPTFDSNQAPRYSATTMGITGQPTGPAQASFPIVTFAGTNAPTNWGGTTPNVTLAENYTLLDNLQWVKGSHTLTVGGQSAWLLYNTISATGNSTPLTLANAVTETEGLNNAFTAISGTGLSYASFLIGEIDKPSFTQYVQQEFGARFRAISPYIQDNWKVNSKLTLDLGVRYDFFPTVTEVHNNMSFFNPNLLNPVTNVNGALQFADSNTPTPVNNYYQNIGPRLGLAYQVLPKTVIHASYGVMFTHGGAVGGSATSLGTLGFSAAPSFAASGSLLSTAPFLGTNGALPTYSLACGRASGAQYGTGYYSVAGPATCGTTGTVSYTAAPSSMGYADPYLGGRAPEYINWAFGIQQQLTNAIAVTVTYVGSEGHFLPADGSNARGYWADQLNPKYLSLGTKLADVTTAETADCANASLGITCPVNFVTTQQLNVALKPFPFQTVTDSFGYVANSNYNAVQVSANMRASHGVTFNVNYTFARSIDDGGTFRTGYPIPAGTIANEPTMSWPADRIERSLSTSDQPQHLVVTGVWDLPMGRTVLAKNAVERAVLGGFKFSETLQAYSGSPLAITATTCQTNQAQSTCMPTFNPSFTGPARINGKWGQGYLAGMSPAPSYIDSSAFVAAAQMNTAVAPAYTFGNAPRTAAYNIYGPGNYDLDIALVRSFPLHLTETTKLNFRAEMYNVTNHTKFAVASAVYGNASFGQVTNDTTATRKAVQLTARIEF
jgi:hypothetical protein